MGVQQKVSFAPGNLPTWKKVAELLASRGFPVQVRMIDGELAFPDELPPENWRELRVGTAQGMVTLRREEDGVLLVTWGNADTAMLGAWNALAWAWAEASAGRVLTDGGALTAAEFQAGVSLPMRSASP